MFFNSDKQLSLRYSNILGIEVTLTLELIKDVISVKFIDPFFQCEIYSNFRRFGSYFSINTSCLKTFRYLSAELLGKLFLCTNC